MHTVPTIPGVKLEVYKQRRQLTPEPDGYVGQLYSGFVVILAVIDPRADPTISLFRDGSDHYILQKDWLNNPCTHAQQQAHTMYLAERQFIPETRVFGIKMPLQVNKEQAINTVNYPENMFMLAQYMRHDGQATDRLHVWKVALVSQKGDFFLTVQQAYNTTAHRNTKGSVCFPRLRAHRLLERTLVAHAPPDLQLTPENDFIQPEPPVVNSLNQDEGIVERWYDARNMGCIITTKGAARVHWSEVPPRPRRRFLVEGEKVTVSTLDTPPLNPRTNWRKMRKARFQLQACGIELG